MEELGKVRSTLKSLEKRLYALNTVLRELYRVKDFLSRLNDDYTELRSYLVEHPEMESLIREYVRDQDILPTVKDVKAKYEAIVEVFREYGPRLDDMEVFFERFRNYRFYVLDDDKIPALAGFLFDDEDEVLLRQTLTRKPFTEDFAREVEGVLMDSFTVKIKGELAPLAIEKYRMAYGGGFSVESPSYTMVYKPEHGIIRVIFSQPSKIPSVDTSVRRLGGEIINI